MSDPIHPPMPQLTDASDAASSLARASELRSQGRLEAATTVMRGVAHRHAGDPDAMFDCAKFIRECGRHAQAAEICEQQLWAGPRSPRLFALAGSIAHELGRFDEARAHYLAALRTGVNINEWFVLQALANTTRYTDVGHPDFALFETHLRDPALTARARASILFAFGKACDDIGDHARAAGLLREANALARSTIAWARGDWDRFVADQLRVQPPQVPGKAESDCIPVFIVGMVRSGTTLVADRLGRDPAVRNRGEMPFIGYLAGQLATHGLAADPQALAEARRIYLAHLRQDDAPATWYVDKHPLNFRYLGQIASLFPQARIIHCRRNRRDNALSIWSQLFGHMDNDYAYDFDDIAAFGAGCDRLMEHWRQRMVLPTHTVDYEQMVEQPERTMAGLRAFLGLPVEIVGQEANQQAPREYAIGSASMWQARQPVYRRSVARWRLYAPFVPELVEKFADADG